MNEVSPLPSGKLTVLSPRRLPPLAHPRSSSPPPVSARPQYIEAHYKSLAFKQHLLRTALKTGAAKGTFVQVKASFKLSEAAKKPPAKKKVRRASEHARDGRKAGPRSAPLFARCPPLL